MRDFFRYAKNRFLYNLLRILVFIALGFILSNFLLVNRVYADTYHSYDTTAQLYDNNNGTLTALTTNSSSSYWYGNVGFIGYSSGAAWGFSTPMPLIEGHTYSLTVYFSTSSNTADSVTFSSVNRIGVGTSLSNAVSSYQNNAGTELVYSNQTSDALQFVFKANISGSYLVVPFCATYSISSETVYFDIFMINDLGISSEVSQDDINNSLSSQTNELNNSINNSTNTITGAIGDTENNINSNIDDMEQNIIDSNKETQEVIKDQFNTCRDSYNLLPNLFTKFTNQTKNQISLNVNEDGSIHVLGTTTSSSTTFYSSSFENFFKEGVSYYFSVGDLPSSVYVRIQKSGSSYISANRRFTYSGQLDTGDVMFMIWITSAGTYDFTLYPIVNEGSTAKAYEPYGEQICTNKMDETNDKLDKAEETRKGIWATIKDLPNQFLNMLKSLFIPDDDYFSNWYSDFKEYIEMKLGFLATPFTIFLDFIETYSDLSSSNDIVINIPDINVPNFEDYKIISATTFNWSDLLKSKTSLNTLWQLYLDFIDVYLILNFLGLCERTYNRIFGGDTSNYEYYTVEDSYTYDSDTGEVLSARRNERTTQKRKVE